VAKLSKRFTDGMTFGEAMPITGFENPRLQKGYELGKAGRRLSKKQNDDLILLCGYLLGVLEFEKKQKSHG
jgi:hypothetical protein